MTFFADQAERLDKFLARTFPEHSRTKLARLVETRQVAVNDKLAKASLLLTPGDRVDVASEPEQTAVHDLTPADIPLEIVYEDDDLLVVNKPRGLATHPAASLKQPSLVNALLASHQLSSGSAAFRPGIVHRLDKETTGVIIVAKTDAAHVALAKQIEQRKVHRQYVAVVHGELDQKVFRIEAPLARDKKNRLRMAVDPKGKAAATQVWVIGRVPAGVVVELKLETGRTHQIRVHMASIGHPVVGDSLYSPHKTELPLQLHALCVEFTRPFVDEDIAVCVDPPEDFVGKAVLEKQYE